MMGVETDATTKHPEMAVKDAHSSRIKLLALPNSHLVEAVLKEHYHVFNPACRERLKKLLKEILTVHNRNNVNGENEINKALEILKREIKHLEETKPRSVDYLGRKLRYSAGDLIQKSKSKELETLYSKSKNIINKCSNGKYKGKAAGDGHLSTKREIQSPTATKIKYVGSRSTLLLNYSSPNFSNNKNKNYSTMLKQRNEFENLKKANQPRKVQTKNIDPVEKPETIAEPPLKRDREETSIGTKPLRRAIKLKKGKDSPLIPKSFLTAKSCTSNLIVSTSSILGTSFTKRLTLKPQWSRIISPLKSSTPELPTSKPSIVTLINIESTAKSTPKSPSTTTKMTTESIAKSTPKPPSTATKITIESTVKSTSPPTSKASIAAPIIIESTAKSTPKPPSTATKMTIESTTKSTLKPPSTATKITIESTAKSTSIPPTSKASIATPIIIESTATSTPKLPNSKPSTAITITIESTPKPSTTTQIIPESTLKSSTLKRPTSEPSTPTSKITQKSLLPFPLNIKPSKLPTSNRSSLRASTRSKHHPHHTKRDSAIQKDSSKAKPNSRSEEQKKSAKDKEMRINLLKDMLPFILSSVKTDSMICCKCDSTPNIHLNSSDTIHVKNPRVDKKSAYEKRISQCDGDTGEMSRRKKIDREAEFADRSYLARLAIKYYVALIRDMQKNCMIYRKFSKKLIRPVPSDKVLCVGTAYNCLMDYLAYMKQAIEVLQPCVTELIVKWKTHKHNPNFLEFDTLPTLLISSMRNMLPWKKALRETIASYEKEMGETPKYVDSYKAHYLYIRHYQKLKAIERQRHAKAKQKSKFRSKF